MSKGFTLIELMIVIAIIALLASIAVPKLGGIKEDAKAAEVQSTLAQLRTGIAIYFAKYDRYPLAGGNGLAIDANSTATQNHFSQDGGMSDIMEKYTGFGVGTDSAEDIPDIPAFGTVASSNLFRSSADANLPAANDTQSGYRYSEATGEIRANLPANTFGVPDWTIE